MMDSVFFYAMMVFLTSLLMSFLSIWIRQRFMSQEQAMQWQKEINTWNEEKKRAAKLGDKKLLARLKRREKRILQIQSKMLKRQTVTLLLNMGMFIGVWQILIFYLGNKTVAYLPFSIPFVTGPPPYPMNLFYWYIICSFLSTTIASRILGVPMGLGTQPQTK
ncbi:TPA: DUF106 domain-containing protein [Candidatus Bathyarchaeota archaeon]|nr:DUF106 domain-containing protein [Candidatus Bathyarchaeota archaeon]